MLSINNSETLKGLPCIEDAKVKFTSPTFKAPINKFTVAIGSKFTGKPVSYRNEGTGEFYEVFPRVDVKLQQALLKPI